jgi:hypothetical protein
MSPGPEEPGGASHAECDQEETHLNTDHTRPDEGGHHGS